MREHLDETWYGDRTPGVLLSALEAIYRKAFVARRARGLARIARDLESVPIVVVGNLTVGGTGKTPLVIRLCERLKAAGLNPGVISRGYGRRGNHQVRVVAETDPADSGDEPLVIARHCGVPVIVDADREAAARTARGLGVDVIISDDGLQRWTLPRDIEICVVDGTRGLGNGRLLPAGPLREPASRLEQVDYIVSNGDPRAELEPLQVWVMRIEPQAFVSLQDGATVALDAFLDVTGQSAIHAVAGIGHPDRFFDTLASLGITADHFHRYADHHEYSARDFDDCTGTVVMTEKDAVKCAWLGLENAWFLRVNAQLPQALENELIARITTLVEAKRA